MSKPTTLPLSSKAASIWILGLFVATLALTQQFPSQQRGLAAETAYQIGVVDNVNLFNGGLTVQIPLGPTYPVSPNLSFGLTASYSSNGWDYEDEMCNANGELIFYDRSVESKHTNAGFGWRVILGKIVTNTPFDTGITYISADGGEHGFYDELHPGTGSTGNVWYTNDSTYLRLRYRTAGACTASPGGSSDCYQIEFPNGTRHEFHDFGTGTAEEPEWLLTQMTDRFAANHFVRIDYSTANQWRISDSHGRSHTVRFAGGRVDTVEVERFDTSAKAVYDFVTEPRTIGVRNLPFTPGCDGGLPPTSVSVPMLTQLTLPDGSAYTMDYLSSWNPPDLLSGGLSSMRLPTGGGFEWTYIDVNFVSQGPELFGEFVGTSFGVATKEIFTVAGDASTREGGWTYTYTRDMNGTPSDPPVPCFHTVTVTDPLDHTTVNYFDSASSGFSRWQYGLPFRRCDGDGNDVSGSPPYLSQEIYDGDVAEGTKLRSIYVVYDSDGRDAGFQQEKNHRLRLRRTVYHDDGDRFKQIEFSDFDGLGHYRNTLTTGNFEGSESRSSRTVYNEDNRTLDIDPETTIRGFWARSTNAP